MQSQIKRNIDNPERLEKLYREDKENFRSAFFEIYKELSDKKIAEYWRIRLEYSEHVPIHGIDRKNHVLKLILICLMCGVMIKFNQIFNLYSNDFDYYIRNAGIVVFFGLSAYHILTHEIQNKRALLLTAVIFIVSAVYVNFLPIVKNSHTINLIYIHLPFFLWGIFGLVVSEFNFFDKNKRIDYIKFNGDLLILTMVILIGGIILTSVTLQLFIMIDLMIEDLYLNYVVAIGLVSSPIVATFIIRKYTVISNKLAPIISNIFSPLVLITLIAYLISIVLTGKDPYNDRDFLIVFNFMLLGVTAIIIFVVSGKAQSKGHRFNDIILFLLGISTLAVDSIALSAITYRLGEYGFSPNKIAMFGLNVLVFGNLLMISIELFKSIFYGKEMKSVEKVIAGYLPLYLIWTIFIIFFMPIIYGYK